jgi:hypothetical protein
MSKTSTLNYFLDTYVKHKKASLVDLINDPEGYSNENIREILDHLSECEENVDDGIIKKIMTVAKMYQKEEKTKREVKTSA